MQFTLKSLFLVTTEFAALLAVLRALGVEPARATGCAVLFCILTYGILLLRWSVKHANSTDSVSLQTIATVPDDVSAAVVINVLSAAGIRAVMGNNNSFGLWGGLVGPVHVLVAQQDLARATEVLAASDSDEEPDEHASMGENGAVRPHGVEHADD